jgi:hypothetical protein
MENRTAYLKDAKFINVCTHCGKGLTANDQHMIDCPVCGYDLDWTRRKAPKQPPSIGNRPESLRLIIAKLYSNKLLNAAEQTAVDEIHDQYAATLRFQSILAHIKSLIGDAGFVSEHISQTKAAIELNVFPSEADRYWNAVMSIGAAAQEHYCFVAIRPLNAQRFEIRRLS